MVSIAYDHADRRTSLTLPNGIVVEYGYDDSSRLTGLTYKQSGSTIGTLTYAYDANGQRTSAGGTYARTGLPAALASATYDHANQIATWAGTSFSYDSNGNLTSDGTRSYTWNARNELASLTGPVNASFAYDAFGRRRSKTVGGTTTQFLYDGLTPVQELAGGTPTANLLTGLGIDEYFTRTDSVGVRNYFTDALGSTVALADGSGTVQTEYTYEPFGGTSTSGAATGNTFGFTGREADGTGVFFYRARYYDPRLQRFTAEDPAGIEHGVNSFAYVSNAPVRWIDPLGRAQEPPGRPPIPLPPGKNGQPNSWQGPGPDGRYTPRYPVPSPTGSQPHVSWDEQDGWWRHHPGDGRPTEHYWPDGERAPSRHPRYPPPPPTPEPPPPPAPSGWWPRWPAGLLPTINLCWMDWRLPGCDPNPLPGRGPC